MLRDRYNKNENLSDSKSKASSKGGSTLFSNFNTMREIQDRILNLESDNTGQIRAQQSSSSISASSLQGDFMPASISTATLTKNNQFLPEDRGIDSITFNSSTTQTLAPSHSHSILDSTPIYNKSKVISGRRPKPKQDDVKRDNYSMSGFYSKDSVGNSTPLDTFGFDRGMTSTGCGPTTAYKVAGNGGTGLSKVGRKWGKVTRNNSSPKQSRSSSDSPKMSNKYSSNFFAQELESAQSQKRKDKNILTEFTQRKQEEKAVKNLLQGTSYISQKPSHNQSSAPTGRDQMTGSRFCHFFENHSKYISLKKFNEESRDTFRDLASEGPLSNGKISVLKAWFKGLSLSERAVALTTIDKDLVNMFKTMYKTYSEEGQGSGKFTARLDTCENSVEADNFQRVGNYQLLYVRPNIHQHFLHSKIMKEKKEAENMLVEKVRIIKVNEEYDALTLDVEMFDNSEYFIRIMKMIDEQFLMRDFKLQKEKEQPKGSILLQNQESDSQNKKKSPSYFLVQDNQRQIYSSSGSFQDKGYMMRDDTWHDDLEAGYGYQSNSEQHEVSLAKCILLVLEKALNVQFNDYQNKISKEMNTFFFNQSTESGLFFEDLKLAKYWQKLTQEKKQDVLLKMSDIEKDLIKDYNQAKFQFDKIRETEEQEETGSESPKYYGNKRFNPDCDDPEIAEHRGSIEDKLQDLFKGQLPGNQEIQMVELPTEYYASSNNKDIEVLKKQRRSRKDRSKRGPNGDTLTSSSSNSYAVNSVSATNNYCDYNANALSGQYGLNDDEDQDEMDPESLKPLSQTQSKHAPLRLNVPVPATPSPFEGSDDQPKNDLFGGNQTQNLLFKFRQGIKSSGLNAKSFEKCLNFIKSLSAHIGFNKMIQIQNSKDRNKLPVCSELETQLVEQFYQYLNDKCQQALIDELLDDEPAATESKQESKCQQKKSENQQEQQPTTKKKNKNKKKNKRKKNQQVQQQEQSKKEEKKDIVIETPAEPQKKAKLSDDEEPQSDVQSAAVDLQSVLSFNPALTTTIGSTKQSLKIERDLELDRQYQSAVDDMHAKFGAFLQNQDSEDEQDWNSDKIQKIQELLNNETKQKNQLLELTNKLEKIDTCEQLLEGYTGNPIGAEIVENILSDTQKVQGSSEFEDTVFQSHRIGQKLDELNQRAEKQFPSEYLQNKKDDKDNQKLSLQAQEGLSKALREFPNLTEEEKEKNRESTLFHYHQFTRMMKSLEDSRFKEERTGLLSNQIHYDKYKEETIGNFVDSDQEEQKKDGQSMLEYVLSRNDQPPTGAPSYSINSDTPANPLRKTVFDKQNDKCLEFYNHLVSQADCSPSSPDGDHTLMKAKGWDPTMQLEFSSPRKELGEQSGGPVEEQQVPKKKNKKNRKKNRRKQKTAAAEAITTVVPTQEHAPALQEVPPNTEGDKSLLELDEVILVEEEQTVEKDFAPKKNNFFDLSVSTETPMTKKQTKKQLPITFLNPDEQAKEKEQIAESEAAEDYVNGIAKKIIVNAVNQVKEEKQPQPKQSTKQQKKKKGKKQPQPQPKTQPKIKSYFNTTSSLSSSSSHRQYTSVYQHTSHSITNQKPIEISNFKADLSDSIKIPQRGKSQSSYGREELVHQQTLDELDSLFPSNEKKQSPGSSSKLRSATLTKERKKSTDLTKASVDLDVQSQKVSGSAAKMEDLDNKRNQSPLLSKLGEAANTKDEELRVTNVKEVKPVDKPKPQPQLSKTQSKKQQRKANKQAQMLAQQKEKELREQQAAKERELKEQKAREEKALKEKLREQAEAERKAQKAKEVKREASPEGKVSYVAKPVPAKETKPVVKEEKKPVAQPTPVEKPKVASKPTLASKPKPAPPKEKPKKANYENYNQMFESVFGGGSTSATTSVKETKKVKVEETQVRESSKEKQPVKDSNKTKTVQKESNQTAVKRDSGGFGVSANLKQESSNKSQYQQKGKQQQPKPQQHQQLTKSSFQTQPQYAVKPPAIHHFGVATPNMGGQSVPFNQPPVNFVAPPQISHQTIQVQEQQQKQEFTQHQQQNSNLQSSHFQTQSTVKQGTYQKKERGVQFPMQQPQQNFVNQTTTTTQYTVNLNFVQTTNTYNQTQQQPQFVGQNMYQNTNQRYRQQPYFMPQQQQNQGKQFVPQNMYFPQNYQQMPYMMPNKFQTVSQGQNKVVIPNMQFMNQQYQAYPQQMYPMYQPQAFPVFEVQPLSIGLQGVVGQDKDFVWSPDVDTMKLESTFYQSLGKSILQLQSKIECKLSKAEPLRLKTFELLQETVQQTYLEVAKESITFDIYGSVATKLAIDSSDMDIAIQGVIPQEQLQGDDSKQLVVSAMERLHQMLETLKCVERNQLISTASVPVIKLVINFEKLSGVKSEDVGDLKKMKVDLIFNDIPPKRDQFDDLGSTQPQYQTKRCAEFVKMKIKEHPFLKPLAQILKKYLSLKGLNSPFQGTISSYGLVLMILSLLNDIKKMNPQFEFMPQHQDENLGRALCHFFNLYGDQFAPSQFFIDSNLEFVEISQGQNLYFANPNSLQITDPVDHHNNVGKQTYNFQLVQDQLYVTMQLILVKFKAIYSYQEKIEHAKRKRNMALQLINHKEQQERNPQNDTQQIDHTFQMLTMQYHSDPDFIPWSQLSVEDLKCKAEGQQQETQTLQQQIDNQMLSQLLSQTLLIDPDTLQCVADNKEEEHQKMLVSIEKQAANVLDSCAQQLTQHQPRFQQQNMYYNNPVYQQQYNQMPRMQYQQRMVPQQFNPQFPGMVVPPQYNQGNYPQQFVNQQQGFQPQSSGNFQVLRQGLPATPKQGENE